MDFYRKDEYTIEDVKFLIANEIEENVHLDYKAAGSLTKEPKKKEEIAKDVSAFANSDGGIIVYGIEEKEHKAANLSYIDGNVYTKEWLEQVIQDNIQRRIDDLIIFPIRDNGDISKTIYIVKIPRSDNAPHMSADKCYYKRYNFRSVKMEEYEVRDTLYRIKNPQLCIIGASLEKEESRDGDTTVEYTFKAWIRNTGNVISKDYKLCATFFNLPSQTVFCYHPLEEKMSSMNIDEYCKRLTSPCKETLFPNEAIEMGHYKLRLPINDVVNAWGKVYFKLTLLYENGGKDSMLIVPSKDIQLYNKEEIEDYIKKEYPDFDLIDML